MYNTIPTQAVYRTGMKKRRSPGAVAGLAFAGIALFVVWLVCRSIRREQAE